MKLSFYETTYYINETKKTVTCKVRCSLTADDKLMEMLSCLTWFADKDVTALREGGPLEFVATAYTDPVDNFDVEIGKKIARAKAESMAYQDVRHTLIKAHRKYDEYTRYEIWDFIAKAEEVNGHNCEYLKQF